MDLSPAVLSRPFLVQTGFVGEGAFALPAGTVTFLLTDVEGSTRLWEERTADMGPAIARHYELLDAAIAAHDGVRPVEQGEGDSIVAAFARAVDAVAAAVEAQIVLQRELPWLTVRMAAHTGEAQLRGEGNYVGRTIIRCARLRACGHGGQVLLSETTAALVADALPPGVALVDLGPARLRDLDRVERVWQVGHAGLRSSFPPLRSLDDAPHNLPTPLTSFVGREADVQTALELVASNRLVTLTGSGGAGKTRLALQVAPALVDLHPGGTWWVELAPVTSGSDVGERVAQAVGLAPALGVDPVEQVVAHLRQAEPTLVVVDNAEHVLDAVAEVAQRLLVGVPTVRILVTSREPVGVPGEVVWRVPSLGVPAVGAPTELVSLESFDSVRLYSARPNAARPNLVVDERSAPHIAAICQRLDGIPLAIELAAARARTMTLDRLAVGLTDAFRLLTGGARTVLPRQQTLLASIAWSVDALDEVERAVFRRLAVFQAPFTLDGAEAVAADGELVDAVMVLDLIARLVDKSLVQFDDESGRYGMLETIRQFALDRLRDGGELATARRRHAHHYARWTQAVGRGEHGLSYRPLLTDMPDVLAALDWSYDDDAATVAAIASGMAAFRANVGMVVALHRQCDWLGRFDVAADPAAWAAAVAGSAPQIPVLRRYELLELLPGAEAILGDDDVRLRTLLREPRAAHASIHGDRTELQQLIRDIDELGDDPILVLLLAIDVMGVIRSGWLDEAIALIDRVEHVLARHDEVLSPNTTVMTSLAKIEAMVLQGRLVEAGEWASLHLDAFGDLLVLAASLQLAYIGLLTGDGGLVERAVVAVQLEGMPAFAPLRHHLAATGSVWRKDWDDAAEQGRLGVEMNRDNGVLQGFFVPVATAALVRVGRLDDAREQVLGWQREVERFGWRPLHTTLLRHCWAMVHLADGRDGAAYDEAHQMLTVAHGSGYALFRIDALELIAEVAVRRGNVAAAARLLGTTTAERQRLGYSGWLWRDEGEAAALAERVRVDAPEAFAEGAALTIEQAVELAQRGRGERDRPTVGWDSLTPTEGKVVDLVASGLPNARIAEQLLMSVATVKTHLTHVFTKTGLSNRTELAAEALRRRG